MRLCAPHSESTRCRSTHTRTRTPAHPPSHPPFLTPSHRRTLPPALAHICTCTRAHTHTLTAHPTPDVFAPSMSGMSFRPVARGAIARLRVSLYIARACLVPCRKCTNCTSTAALAARRCSSRRRSPSWLRASDATRCSARYAERSRHGPCLCLGLEHRDDPCGAHVPGRPHRGTLNRIISTRNRIISTRNSVTSTLSRIICSPVDPTEVHRPRLPRAVDTCGTAAPAPAVQKHAMDVHLSYDSLSRGRAAARPRLSTRSARAACDCARARRRPRNQPLSVCVLGTRVQVGRCGATRRPWPDGFGACFVCRAASHFGSQARSGGIGRTAAGMGAKRMATWGWDVDGADTHGGHRPRTSHAFRAAARSTPRATRRCIMQHASDNSNAAMPHATHNATNNIKENSCSTCRTEVVL